MSDVKPIAQHSAYLDMLIQSLVNGGALEMEFGYGLELYHRGLQDIALLHLNVPYSELGISERRESCKPKMMVLQSASGDYKVVDENSIGSESSTPEGSIAVMRLRGMMQNEGGLSSRGIYDFADDMRAAYRNRNVAAIIVDTDSGGGQSGAGNLAREVINERNKPVLANVHFAASAAYNAISGADEIIAASKESRFGGIGTFITLDMKLLTEYKARFMDIYADESGGKNKPFRAALDGDFSILKAMVNQMTGEFQDSIKAARPLSGDRLTIKETLSGAMFNATEAKNRGLSDGTGNFNYLLSRTKAWIKKKKA